MRRKRASLRRLKARFMLGRPLPLEAVQDAPKLQRKVISVGFRVLLYGGYVVRHNIREEE